MASLGSMSSVTVCDKMADSICDTSDHKYTTQPQLIHHLDQEESHLCPLSLKLASTQNYLLPPVPNLSETIRKEVEIFLDSRLLSFMFGGG